MSDTNTHLDELIKAERAKANAKIAQLRRAAAAEQRKVHEKVVELLRERHADQYERLVAEAGLALAAEKDARSKRATGSVELSRVHARNACPAGGRAHGWGVSP